MCTFIHITFAYNSRIHRKILCDLFSCCVTPLNCSITICWFRRVLMQIGLGIIKNKTFQFLFVIVVFIVSHNNGYPCTPWLVPCAHCEEKRWGSGCWPSEDDTWTGRSFDWLVPSFEWSSMRHFLYPFGLLKRDFKMYLFFKNWNIPDNLIFYYIN